MKKLRTMLLTIVLSAALPLTVFATEIQNEEALEKNKYIPYKAGETITNGKFSITLPSGFSLENSSNDGVYTVSEKQTTNITYTTGPGTKELSSKTLAQTIKDQLGANVMIISNSSQKIDGGIGAKVVVDVNKGAYTFTQIYYVVTDGTSTHSIVFTEDKNSGYADAFEESIKTVKVK